MYGQALRTFGFLVLLSLGAQVAGQNFGPIASYPDAAGTFSSNAPQRVLVGRFDSDPFPDVIAYSGVDAYFRNDGGGGFLAATPLQLSAQDGQVADLNGDGVDDAVFVEPNTGTMTTLIATGAGSFNTQTYNIGGFPTQVRVGDTDGDGDIDVVTRTGSEIAFWVNSGNGALSGSFTISSGQLTGSQSATLGPFDYGDIDGDGDPDLVVYAQFFNPFPTLSRRLYWRRNNGGGFAFGSSNTTSFSPGELRITNTDNNPGNGDEILFVTGGFVVHYDFTGTGFSQGPTSATMAPINGLDVGDFDNDGVTDVVASMISSGAGLVQVLKGNGAGSFTVTNTLDLASPNALPPVAGDLNLDGYPEVIAARPAFVEVSVFQNAGEAINFRKLMISEVSWGNPDWVEITNYGTTARNIQGWRVQWKDNGTVKTSQPLTETLAPGESLVVIESGGSLPGLSGQVNNALPQLGTSSNDLVVGLLAFNGAVVDEVRITSSGGSYDEGTLGGSFRGLARRMTSSASASVERIWGLDSNSGADWTEQPTHSAGRENTSNGPRGTDPVPASSVVINELDDSPDYIELLASSDVDLKDWFFFCSPLQNTAHSVIRPWPGSYPVSAGEYAVVGDGTSAPSELPGGGLYTALSTVNGGNIPWTTEEYDCALYDALGRLVDLVRVCGHDDAVVHNFPRAPAAWDDFLGYSVRATTGNFALGRAPGGADTDGGGDWFAVSTRTMGSPNIIPASPVSGRSDAPDARMHDTAIQGGLVMIINAGPQYAGHVMTLFFDFGHFQGQGPLLGVGPRAVINWTNFSFPQIAPFGAILDSRGSYRFDLPPGSIPAALDADHRVVIQDSAGVIVAITRVIEQDHD